MNTPYRLSGLGAALQRASAACPAPGGDTRAADDPQHDQRISMTVSERLRDSTRLDGAALGVLTRNGSVMLSGFARSAAERQAAERVASQVEGVRSVDNRLSVCP